MPQNYSPTIQSGIDIFREIGMRPSGQASPAMGAPAMGGGDIVALLNSGDVPSLMKAQQLIQERLNSKTAALTPTGNQLTPPPAPKAPARPAPALSMQPGSPAPAPAPAPTPAPSPAAQGGASPSVLADLTKLINATKGLVGGTPANIGTGTPPSAPPASGANPILSNNAVPALPGRPTM